MQKFALTILKQRGIYQVEGANRPPQSFVPPVVGTVAWRDASPQRNAESRSISYLNQFPNTWEPAESLLLSRGTKMMDKETVSVSGKRSCGYLFPFSFREIFSVQKTTFTLEYFVEDEEKISLMILL
jgi:hypothetical protein